MAKTEKLITKQMKSAGWTVKAGKGHIKWYCGCGAHGPIIQASTIGQGRGAQNFRSLVRKQGKCSVDLKLG